MSKVDAAVRQEAPEFWLESRRDLPYKSPRTFALAAAASIAPEWRAVISPHQVRIDTECPGSPISMTPAGNMLPTGEIGQTVMETAIKHDVPGIVAECGGACSCATATCMGRGLAEHQPVSRHKWKRICSISPSMCVRKAALLPIAYC